MGESPNIWGIPNNGEYPTHGNPQHLGIPNTWESATHRNPKHFKGIPNTSRESPTLEINLRPYQQWYDLDHNKKNIGKIKKKFSKGKKLIIKTTQDFT